jgi:Rieske Fe-S protein
MLDAIPADGSPVKVAYIADRVDAWTVDPSQPLGAVYLRRTGKSNEVQAFNATCPHAGCFVAWLPQDKIYLCPCHNSAFLLDGEKTNHKGKTNPSPRAMDSLEVEVREGGEVWVDFHNYVVGQHEKQIK